MGNNKLARQLTQNKIARSFTSTEFKNDTIKRFDDKTLFTWNAFLVTFFYVIFAILLIILLAAEKGSCNKAGKTFMSFNIIIFLTVVPAQNIVTVVLIHFKKMNPNLMRMVDYGFLVANFVWSLINMIVFFAASQDCYNNGTSVWSAMLLILLNSMFIFAKLMVMTVFVLLLALTKFNVFGAKGKALKDFLWPEDDEIKEDKDFDKHLKKAEDKEKREEEEFKSIYENKSQVPQPIE